MQPLAEGDIINAPMGKDATRADVQGVMQKGMTESGHVEMLRYEVNVLDGQYVGQTLILGHEELSQWEDQGEATIMRKEPTEDMSKKPGRAPNDEGKQISMIRASGGIGQIDAEPRVVLSVIFTDGTEHSQPGTPDQARSVAFGILEAAVESERDAALADFAMGNKKRNASILADAIAWVSKIKEHRADWFEKRGQ